MINKRMIKHKNAHVVSGWTIQELDASPDGTVEISLDLGISSVKVEVMSGTVFLPDGREIPVKSLKKSISGPEDCVAILKGKPYKMYLFSETKGKYYKLFQPEKNMAPTVVINNATMHSIKPPGPWRDAVGKVEELPDLHAEKCLDTCCGAGYSAQLLAGKFNCEVVTCEREENVLKLASLNPWSKSLFTDDRITVYAGDVRDCIDEYRPYSCSLIFHDPPTIFQAGELYSEELYRKFHQILCSGGCLYHYIGAPGKKQGKDFTKGVMQRLRKSGFMSVKRCYGGLMARLE